MKILYNNNDLNEALYGVSSLGFVPTMGSLHKGHSSLIKKSVRECKKTIVSIFINPTQFDKRSDYKRYPTNNKKDLLILKKLNVDFVFLPKEKEIYSFKRKIQIKLAKKDKILCAKYRKGHFEGVIDVMERLTKIIKPNKIYMGEKDFQQFYFVKKFIGKKHPFKIISCKTIRDRNKVALSSRNLLLDKKDLKKVGKLISELMVFKKKLTNNNLKKSLLEKKKYLTNFYGIKIEYLDLRNKFNFKKTKTKRNSKLFICFYIKKVRLIDNF